jgi:hypothetical protein
MCGEGVCGQNKLHHKIKLTSPFLAKTPEYVHFGFICCLLLVKHPLRLQLEFPLKITVRIRSGFHRLSIDIFLIRLIMDLTRSPPISSEQFLPFCVPSLLGWGQKGSQRRWDPVTVLLSRRDDYIKRRTETPCPITMSICIYSALYCDRENTAHVSFHYRLTLCSKISLSASWDW